MYKVELENVGAFSFRIASDSQRLSSKAAEIEVGEMKLTPSDMFLAGLAGCVGVYIRKYAEGTNLKLGHFKVTCESEFSKDYPVCFENISIAIDLKGVKLDEKRIKSLVHFAENCPIHNTIKGNPDIRVSVS